MKNQFTLDALKKLNSSSEQDLEAAFGDLADVVAVNCFTNFESDLPMANEAGLSKEDLHLIQSALFSWIEKNENHVHITSAIWVLSKFHAESMIPEFNRLLQVYVEKAVSNVRPIGQLLINLSNLGENTIPNGSYSSLEYGLNLDNAIQHLANKRES